MMEKIRMNSEDSKECSYSKMSRGSVRENVVHAIGDVMYSEDAIRRL
jgi:hypothetical protein